MAGLRDSYIWDYPNTLSTINLALDDHWKIIIDDDFLGIKEVNNEVMFYSRAVVYDLKGTIIREIEQSKFGADFKLLREEWSDWVVDGSYQRWLLRKASGVESILG